MTRFSIKLASAAIYFNYAHATYNLQQNCVCVFIGVVYFVCDVMCLC